MTKPSDLLPKNIRKEIDEWAKRYPVDQRQSAVLQALMIVQKHNNGWLTQELMEAVADFLNMPPIAVYEVATFYSLYDLNPVGSHKIGLCTNVSCMLMGSEEIASHLKRKLGIGFGETTADGKFTLKEVECLGACSAAPVFHCGKSYYEKLTPPKVDEILDELSATKNV
jgi:NADH-quinone oxidoreductase subunit E